MSDLPTPAGISADDWNATPASVRALVWNLHQRLSTAEEQIAQLAERLRQHSGNSSKPPSSDPPNARTRPKRARSGRKAGGQRGHPGRTRALTPLDQVPHIIDLRPTSCEACGTLLMGDDPQPQRHQVTELPRIEPEVTEYRCHTLTCMACGRKTSGVFPAMVPPGAFGPRLQATVGYFSGRFGMSQRDTVEMFSAVFHTALGLGSVATLETAVSAALAQPMTEALVAVQQQAAANLDETGWYEHSKRTWLWVAATPLVAVFLILATRGAAGVHRLLGETFAGVVGSDRWSAYNWLEVSQRQLCWAHLKRDFQKLVERGGASQRLGAALLLQEAQLFRLWHRVRDGPLARAEFQAAVAPLRAEVQKLLREGAKCAHAQTRHTCENLLKCEPALWTFVDHAGVEPTNNQAERCLRRGVLWRHRSFGTQSASGSRFVERILTAVTSLRLQNRDVLDYLTATCAAAIAGATPPSLLPDPSGT